MRMVEQMLVERCKITFRGNLEILLLDIEYYKRMKKCLILV